MSNLYCRKGSYGPYGPFGFSAKKLILICKLSSKSFFFVGTCFFFDFARVWIFCGGYILKLKTEFWSLTPLQNFNFPTKHPFSILDVHIRIVEKVPMDHTDHFDFHKKVVLIWEINLFSGGNFVIQVTF